MKFHKITFKGCRAFPSGRTDSRRACGRKDRHEVGNRALLKCFDNLGTQLAN